MPSMTFDRTVPIPDQRFWVATHRIKRLQGKKHATGQRHAKARGGAAKAKAAQQKAQAAYRKASTYFWSGAWLSPS